MNSKRAVLLLVLLALVFVVGAGWSWVEERYGEQEPAHEAVRDAEDPGLRIVEPAEGQRIPRAQVYATLVSSAQGEQDRVRVHVSGQGYETDRFVTFHGTQTTLSFTNMPDGTYTMTATPLNAYDEPLYDQTIVRHFFVDADGIPNAAQDAEVTGTLEELQEQGYEIVIDGVESTDSSDKNE